MSERTLSARELTNADINVQKYTTYLAVLPEDHTYTDVFDPAYWRHHRKLNRFDVIRLAHARGDFDIYVTVRARVAGGIVVDFHGGRPPVGIDPYNVALDELEESMKIKVCPIDKDGKPIIKTEYLAKTKWRLIGLDSQEVKRDINTKEEAEVELAIYLASIRYRMPTSEEVLVELKRREATLVAKSTPEIPSAA